MKDINVTVSTKASRLIAGFLALVMIAAIGFAFWELKSIRRDLYAVRTDYYGTGTYDEDYGQVDYNLVSQTVKKLRVYDYDSDVYYKEDYTGPEYVREDVRVLEVRVKNNQDYLYSYYDSLAAVGEDGVLQRTVQVHDDDNDNEWYSNYGSLELAPGGEATLFIYLLDNGSEITSLYDTDFSQSIQLQ